MFACLSHTSSNLGARWCEILGTASDALEVGEVRTASRRRGARWIRSELDPRPARGAERMIA
jgi:hypothetical protein